MFGKLFGKRRDDPQTRATGPAATVDERWLLAARGFSAVFLTAHARGMSPMFDQPPDPLSTDTWRQLAAGIDVDDEQADALVVSCARVGQALDVPLPKLVNVVSRATSLLYTAWPGNASALLVERSASHPDDADLARALSDAASAAQVLNYNELITRTREVLAAELAASGIDQVELDPDEEDTMLVAEAMCELMAAEWALEDAGRAGAAERIALARATIGTALAGLWSPSAELADRPARLASVTLALLQRGWG